MLGNRDKVYDGYKIYRIRMIYIFLFVNLIILIIRKRIIMSYQNGKMSLLMDKTELIYLIDKLLIDLLN